MTQELLSPQWGKTLLDEMRVADKEFQIWMEDITGCVNDLSGGSSGGSTIIINGVKIGDLTLEGRSTEFNAIGEVGTYTHFENFSYSTVPSGEVVQVRNNQEMVLVSDLMLDGEILLDGDVAFAGDSVGSIENVGSGARVYKDTLGNIDRLRTFIGGTALTAVENIDDVTFNLNNTAVTPATYTNANITVDAQGRITAAASGASGSIVTFFQVQDDGITGQLTTSAYVTLAGMWGLPSLTSSNFSWNGATGVLTVNTSGIVEFDFKATGYQTANNRQQLQIDIYKNGSIVLVRDFQYASRNNTQRSGSAYIHGFSDNAVATDTYEFRVSDVGVASNIGDVNVAGATYIKAKHYG